MYLEELKGWLTPDQYKELEQAMPSSYPASLDFPAGEAYYRLGVQHVLKYIRDNFVKEK